MKTVPPRLIELIEAHQNFVLIGHSDPDGDCVASQLGLALFLRRLGKKRVETVSPGPFRRAELEVYRHDFLDHIPRELRSKTTVAVILDCSTLDRIGYLADELEGMEVCVIDHHGSGEDFGSVRYIDETAPSVTAMVWLLIEAMGYEASGEEAELLLFGLATDTGFFRHVEDKREDIFQIVGRMNARGASPKKIFHQIYGGRSLESRQLFGLLLSRAEAHFGGKVILSYESLEEQRRYGSENRDSDSLYQQLQGVAGCAVVALIREEEPGRCSVGLRSLSWPDVGKIAQAFGGGGHALAAGFERLGSIDEIRRELIAHLSAFFPK
ncbi:MAG TPA: bifunctional oligoribonuclease/PAP phosphatase NrnA [Sediminispirochaeta sp.]|nr:bifunctional oligoribonuclease/PAP phosphatase NrnA [Sediminispirochaeta sp.]